MGRERLGEIVQRTFLSEQPAVAGSGCDGEHSEDEWEGRALLGMEKTLYTN